MSTPRKCPEVTSSQLGPKQASVPMPEHTAVRGQERFLGERQESENGGTHEQKTTRDRAHTGRRLALHDGGAAQTGKCPYSENLLQL